MNGSVILQDLPWIAGIIGVTVLVSLAVVLVLRHRSLREERDNLRKADTEAALESADLQTLGFHLVERLGSASVRNYRADDEVRDDFDRAFGAVRSYLAEPEPEPESAAAPAPELGAIPAPNGGEEQASRTTPSPNDEALASHSLEVTQAEDNWTALAQARRDFELALAASLDLSIDDRRRASTSRLLAMAIDRGVLSKSLANRLQRSVSVASKAIHGEPVHAAEASESLVSLRAAIEELGASLSPVETKGRRKFEVVPASDGWKVIAPIGSAGIRLRSYPTQTEAASRAREFAYKSGGGEVVIHGRDGRIRNVDTVASSDPFPSRKEK